MEQLILFLSIKLSPPLFGFDVLSVFPDRVWRFYINCSQETRDTEMGFCVTYNAENVFKSSARKSQE